MTPGTWLLLLAAVLLLVHLGWTTWTLTRLRRLEGRVRRAWAVLDGALVRRAELAAAVARERGPELGEQLRAELAAAAAGARSPAAGDREAAENMLGRLLRRIPVEVQLPEAADADVRVGLARRFYNDAVRDTRSLRAQRLSRVFKLHGRRPLPRYFDIDDGQDAVITSSAAGGSGTRG
ncbi:MAG TPA: hypothetical protein VGO95_07630 [Modestobacter sp.]|nr:hypothetical protein [Modestobacter sp.]